MATPAEHQYEAVLLLARSVTAVLEAARTYLERLGNDRGKSGRINRRSHLGLFKSAAEGLAKEWRNLEPGVFDESLQHAFTTATLLAVIGNLETLSEREIDDWDDGVRSLEAQAAWLDRTVRAFLQGVQSVPSIPGYEIVGEIARGGFGAVYKARDAAGIHRAVKVLSPSALAPQTYAAERFQREGKLLASLNHPGVVRYIQLVHGASAGYLVMELINGRRLSDWAREHDDLSRIDAIINTLDALQHIHEHDVMHRDLKPSNILVEDDTNRVVIVDLGIAWLVGDPTATMTQASAWSAAYAPQEVLVDPRASRGPKHDIYSMGVVLYEILAGQRPLLSNRVPLTRHRDGLKPIDIVLDRALAPEETRFASAREFAEALREARSGIVSPWSTVYVAAGRIRNDVLRKLLLSAARHGEDGDLATVAVAIAGLAESLRIHYTRAYRIARGSDAPAFERYLPAKLSLPASELFPGITDLCTEPVLAEDKYGEAAVAQLGFRVEDLSIFRQASRFVLCLADAPRRREEDLRTAPPPETLARALCSLAKKVISLEDSEPAIVRSFAQLAGGSGRG